MIKAITLKNFKRHKAKTIDFKDGLTLLIGGNNEGKSTILHALAVWEFCKNYLRMSRGNKALYENYRGDGVGMSIDDFTPINIPELKYLWTNLKPSSGYNLTIKCNWDFENEEKFLEVGLALANDRLFVKITASNIKEGTKIPVIAYLPPFAGISDKELWFYPAERQKLIGQGLAGSVLRNTVIDMYNTNLEKRRNLKGDKKKISNNDLDNLRLTDPYEILNSVLFSTFSCQLFPKPFDLNFHHYLKVELSRGEMISKRFRPFPNFKNRDIMVEGSGFLQWMSVYTFALNEGIDILLLDEPDAHLHCSLQSLLFAKLEEIIKINHKQILIATHSTDIIKNIPFERIMDVNRGSCKYINNPSGKIKLLSGLGAEFSPIFHELVRTKNVLFVENDSDCVLLKIFAEKLKIEWPNNLTIWSTASKHDYRNHVIDIIKSEIPEINAISLTDRDKSEYNNTMKSLKLHSHKDIKRDISPDQSIIFARFRSFRRSEIENYLICKSVLSEISGSDEAEIDTFFGKMGIVLPPLEVFKQSDQVEQNKPIFELSGKEFIEAFCDGKKFNKYDIARCFTEDEICDDIKTLLEEIVDMCNQA